MLSMKITKALLDDLTSRAKASPRLRMNHNFHLSLDDKCHRMLNAVEPGANIPIHRHPTKNESFVVLRGKVRSTTYNDDGSIIESVALARRMRCMEWISPRVSGTNWNRWSPVA